MSAASLQSFDTYQYILTVAEQVQLQASDLNIRFLL